MGDSKKWICGEHTEFVENCRKCAAAGVIQAESTGYLLLGVDDSGIYYEEGDALVRAQECADIGIPADAVEEAIQEMMEAGAQTVWLFALCERRDFEKRPRRKEPT
jgi:hypothetical protein